MLNLETLQAFILHDVIKYLIFAGGLSLLLWLFARRLARRRLQERRAQRGDYLRETAASLLSAVLFALCSLLGVFWFSELGLNRLYWDLDRFGMVYAGASLLLMILAHDAYFYWTHRLLHQPWLMRHMHRLHHRSRTPTPWAAYAFDPGEALVQALFPVLFALLVPLHPKVLLLWSLHMIVRNVMGHSGHELFPDWMLRSRAWGWLTSCTHHDLHHRHGRSNYGLYFSWWDRWMGTEHPDYQAHLERILTDQTDAAAEETLRPTQQSEAGRGPQNEGAR